MKPTTKKLANSRKPDPGNLEKVIKELPSEIQQEVLDFAEFLMSKRKPPKQKRMRLSWAGGLKEFRDKYTALDLQKKALEWWDEDLPR